MTAYQRSHARELWLRRATVGVITFLALLGFANPAPAQSTGAFAGAIVELTPPRNADGSFRTINSILAGIPAGGTFYLEGNVYVNKTTENCTVSADKDDLVDVSFDHPNKRSFLTAPDDALVSTECGAFCAILPMLE